MKRIHALVLILIDIEEGLNCYISEAIRAYIA